MSKRQSQQDIDDSGRVCIAAFAGAHGVHGHSKVKAFTAEPQSIAGYGLVESEDKSRNFTLKIIRILKQDIVVVSAKEITSREDAISLQGTKLYVSREQFDEPDEEEFYITDLVGLKVITTDGDVIGKVVAVQNFGAGDILEIREMPDHKGSHMVPFTKQAVPTIQINEGIIALHDDYLPGMDAQD